MLTLHSPCPAHAFPALCSEGRRRSRLPTPPRCLPALPSLFSSLSAALRFPPPRQSAFTAQPAAPAPEPPWRTAAPRAQPRAQCPDTARIPPPVGASAALIRPAAPQSVPALPDRLPEFHRVGKSRRADRSLERRICSLNSPSQGAGTCSAPAHGDVPSPLLSGPHMLLFYICFSPGAAPVPATRPDLRISLPAFFPTSAYFQAFSPVPTQGRALRARTPRSRGSFPADPPAALRTPLPAAAAPSLCRPSRVGAALPAHICSVPSSSLWSSLPGGCKALLHFGPSELL